MKKTSNTIVFFGNERIATGVTTSAPILRGLITSGYDVVAIVVNNRPSKSRNKRTLEVAEIAKANNIPILSPKKPIDIISQLKSFKASAAILVAYGRIIPQEVIDVFPAGIVNLHPSLLPQHRGPIPLESVILNGETQTGVSIMSLTNKMDAGPVYDQAALDVEPFVTKQQLADKLLDIGTKRLLSSLPHILDGTMKPKTQDETRATYDNLIDKDASRLDWLKPALQLEREIRAYRGWPGSRTDLAGKDIVITKASVVSEQLQPGQIKIGGNSLMIGCSQDSLEILELKPAGKSEMSTKSFLAGYRNLLLDTL